MPRTLLVLDDTQLCREVSELFRAYYPNRDHAIYYIGANTSNIDLPIGSVKKTWTTYSGFLRYIDRNRDSGKRFTEIILAAQVFADPRVWVEAFCSRENVRNHILKFATSFSKRLIARLVGRSYEPEVKVLLDAKELVLVVSNDLSDKGLIVIHPHGAFYRGETKIKSDEQISFSDNRRSYLNKIKERLLLGHRRSRSWITVPEADIWGVTPNDTVVLHQSEKISTDKLIKSISHQDRARFKRIVLTKRCVEQSGTAIASPVIGENTIQLAKEYGITDIMIDDDCVVQGKEAVLAEARGAGISLTIIQS